jgi:CubicO group peptidase (beta-lactamase class C family)
MLISPLGSRVFAKDLEVRFLQCSLLRRYLRSATLIAAQVLVMLGCMRPEVVRGGDSGPALEHLVIDAHPPRNPWFKMVGDMDGDGDRDIVVAGAKGTLVWYANPSWRKTLIAEGSWDGVNGETADVDGDGDTDIVMGGIVWFENPSVGHGPWVVHRISRQRAHDIEIADLNGDGRLDVVARDQSAFGKTGNKVYVFFQGEKNEWSRLVIDCPHGEGLKLGDIDADGDADIVLGGLWHENPGDTDSRWPPHRYAPEWTEGDTKVELADFNGDGRTDIVLSPAELKGETYRVSWFAAPADRRRENWNEIVVIPSIECVIHSLGIGDFDGDGTPDIAIAEMHQGQDPDEVMVLYNEQQGRDWRKQVLSRSGSHDIVVTDIDGDGDPDIVGANHSGSHPLELWRNERVSQQPDFKPGDSSAGNDYFPRPESQGGWRKLDNPDAIRGVGIDPDELAELKQWLLGSDERDFAAVVICNGYIVLEVERSNSASTDSRRVASVSKAICATVLAIAAEQSQQGKTPKKMSLDDPAFDFIPWAQPLSDPRKAKITVKQLLNHTSGITPEVTGARNQGPWRHVLGHDGDPLTAKLAFDPGTRCGYSTFGLYHAALVCEDVTGKPYEKFAIEALLKPIGCEHWWFQYFDGDKEGDGKYGRHASHSMGMPARDLARVAYCMMRDGRWTNQQVIPSWFVHETAAPTHDVKAPELRFNRAAESFSHGWELPARLTDGAGEGIPQDARFKPGSGGQLIAFVPSLDLVVTRQTGSSGAWEYEEYLRRACDAVTSE